MSNEYFMRSFKIMSTPVYLLFFKVLTAFLISSEVNGTFISSFSVKSGSRLISDVLAS